MRSGDKVKILYVITSTGIGGAEKMLYELVTRLDRERFEPMVCSLKPMGQFGEKLRGNDIPFFSLDMPEASGFRGALVTLRSLYRLLMLTVALSPDLMHTFLFRANQVGRFIGWIQGVPVISAIRVLEMEKEYHHTCDARTSFMSTHYTAVSEEVRQYTIRKSGLKPEKITTIPNGIDLALFHGIVADISLPESLGLAPDNRLIIFVGRLSRQKGLPFLLEAFCSVAEAVPSARLLIVGEGEDEESLKADAGSRGITDKVVFTGIRSDIPALLSLCEVVVLPSLWEGMPNALLEAMASAKPVVATSAGGVPEVVVDGETGLLVPPSDPKALATALLTLLNDPDRAREMGEKGFERVKRRFDIAATVRRTEELYRQVLLKKGVEI